MEGWGPITIHHELSWLPNEQGHTIPSVKAIGNYLRAQKRTRPYRLENALPDTKMDIGRHAHDVWQMDAEGNKDVAPIGRFTFINIKDTCTKTYVQSFPRQCSSPQSHATFADYQLVLRLAWAEFGICNCVQVDHESIYYDNTHLSPFPTKFHLWLLAMGVEMMLTPKGKPYRQGAAERCHQTLDVQICQNHGCENFEQLLTRSRQRRQALNEYIPCRMLKDKAPLAAFPEARHSGRSYSMERESSLFNEKLALEYLVKCKGWQRKVFGNNIVQLGGHRYYLTGSIAGQELMIIATEQRRLVFTAQDGSDKTWDLPLKGYTFKELAGSITKHTKWEEQHQVALGTGVKKNDTI